MQDEGEAAISEHHKSENRKHDKQEKVKSPGREHEQSERGQEAEKETTGIIACRLAEADD